MFADCSICANSNRYTDRERVPLAVVRGLCEKCFRAQYLAEPIKQRENAQAVVKQCDDIIREFTMELNRAKSPPQPKFSMYHNGRGWTNSFAEYCPRCNRLFGGKDALASHKAACDGKQPKYVAERRSQTTKTPKPAKPRASKPAFDPMAHVDLEDSE